jgi:hypothetical protein
VELLFWLVAGAVALGGVWWTYHRKQRRRQELAAMAIQLGLTYSPVDTQGCVDLPFALLKKGDGRGTENVLAGHWHGMPVTEFDYWYYEESRDTDGHTTRTTYRFSCAVTEIDAAMSPLAIERENLLTRLAGSLGFRDIDFELDEFNRAFTVKGGDRKFAFDFVDQRMMRWLLGTGSGFSFEACGRWLLVSSKRRRPTELVPLLGTLRQFRDQVPRVVFDLYGLRSTG